MNEQFYRLCFHMRRTASSLRSKLFPFSLNKILESANDLAATVEEIEEFRELDKRLQQEYEEHIRSEPVLIPQNTMYFGGGRNKKRVNFLNADHYRAEIKKAYTLAISHGINVFVVNYSKPIGLLALEILLDLRCAGETFRLYTVHTAPVRYIKSYRLIRETDIEIFWMLSKCDYRYNRLTTLEMFYKISSRVGYIYNEDGIQIEETNLEGWDDE